MATISAPIEVPASVGAFFIFKSRKQITFLRAAGVAPSNVDSRLYKWPRINENDFRVSTYL